MPDKSHFRVFRLSGTQIFPQKLNFPIAFFIELYCLYFDINSEYVQCSPSQVYKRATLATHSSNTKVVEKMFSVLTCGIVRHMFQIGFLRRRKIRDDSGSINENDANHLYVMYSHG